MLTISPDGDVLLDGKPVVILPLRDIDWQEINARYGGAENLLGKLREGSPAAVRFQVWVVLRNTFEDLTEHQAGTWLSVDPKVTGRVSGLLAQAAGLIAPGDLSDWGELDQR